MAKAVFYADNFGAKPLFAFVFKNGICREHAAFFEHENPAAGAERF